MKRAAAFNSPIRVGIVDDHPVFRAGLRHLLDRDPEVSVEWEHPNSIGLAARLEESPVDVVLMDLELGTGPNGLQATREAKARWPNLQVIIVSASLDPESSKAALAAGSSGYLAKDILPAELLASIRALAPGSLVPRGGGTNAPLALSRREQQVLLEIRRGKTNREIAAALGVSRSTVNKHVQKVLQKLRVRNRAQAAAGHRDSSV